MNGTDPTVLGAIQDALAYDWEVDVKPDGLVLSKDGKAWTVDITQSPIYIEGNIRLLVGGCMADGRRR